MTLRQNSFEATGVTPGVTGINATNSATAGDAMLGLGTIVYSNAVAAHGTLSALLNNASGSNSAVQFPGSGTLSGTSVTSRVYLRVTDSPSQATHVLRIGSSAGGTSILARAVIGTDRKLFVQDATGTTVWTAGTALSINTWYRLELAAAVGTTTSNGTIKFDYYAGDGTTAVEAGYSSTAANTGTAVTVGTVSAGKYSTTTWTSAAYIDDFACNDGTLTYIGPAAASVVGPPSVNAGPDITQSINTGAVTLTATATPATGGTITGYQWSQVSGPACTIANPTSATCTISPPASAGQSVFRCTVTQTG